MSVRAPGVYSVTPPTFHIWPARGTSPGPVTAGKAYEWELLDPSADTSSRRTHGPGVLIGFPGTTWTFGESGTFQLANGDMEQVGPVYG